VLVFLVGALLVMFSSDLIPIGIGYGIMAYAVAVAFFTLLGVWRRRMMMRV
jgi:multisubunit Na+/H+ antiporter MnhC subunit